jgi:hypothetical protein
VLDLYARMWEGQPLGDDEYVLCADEKTQLQALRRCHPDLAAAPGRIRRSEFEYPPRRHAGLSGRLRSARRPGARPYRPNHRHHPFGQLVERVMSAEPYASAARVYQTVDNGSFHQGPHAVIRMRATWPTAQLVHLPVHANRLNQKEIHFSIVQRKVIKPQDFADLEELAERLLVFQVRCSATAEPFDRHFGRKSLDRLLQRLAAHQPLAA